MKKLLLIILIMGCDSSTAQDVRIVNTQFEPVYVERVDD